MDFRPQRHEQAKHLCFQTQPQRFDIPANHAAVCPHNTKDDKTRIGRTIYATLSWNSHRLWQTIPTFAKNAHGIKQVIWQLCFLALLNRNSFALCVRRILLPIMRQQQFAAPHRLMHIDSGVYSNVKSRTGRMIESHERQPTSCAQVKTNT